MVCIEWAIGSSCPKSLRESFGQQRDQTSQSKRKPTLNIHWKDWSWNSNTLATWCKELTHWKRPWWWERLRAGGEGDDRGWDDWVASLTQWTWVLVDSGSWWWTERPGMLQYMGLQRVWHDWAIELNWSFILILSQIEPAKTPSCRLLCPFDVSRSFLSTSLLSGTKYSGFIV